MQEFEKLGVFYLGRQYDLETRQGREGLLLYDSRDLVTHAVCVGMTGSGKTGLCLSLLEEAAIDGIPAIVVDPKGDLGNLLLTFPELRPQDFEPWVNEDDAKRKGLSRDGFAAAQSELWKKGLAAWGQDGARIERLRAAADFAIYTPGSDAGLPVSVLKSFAAPPAALLEDRELLRDRIAATATALLALLGIEADPLQSREHILIANLLDRAWAEGRDLTIAELIHDIQTPPISRVGVLEMDAFYPAKDRFQLAMQINNLLASPGFEAWMEGAPLDIDKILYTPQGRPRVAIFSIAHLSDAERMFFVSLLLNQTLSWVRTQSGATSLRALFYMDEIFGYFPPVANPPSKKPLLTLLKQARAFGLGVVLATQNPVDLDYKGLSNAGTWFIGRLQTEQDKNRVLDGLEGAVASAGAKFDRQRLEQVLSGLGNRVFLMNNVHDDAPEVFETRWALSYLRGPLTRVQIKTLMAERKAGAAQEPAGIPSARKAAGPAAVAVAQAGPRPVLPPDVPQFFLPVRSRASGDAALIYEPMLYAGVDVKFTDARLKVDHSESLRLLTEVAEGPAALSWDSAGEVEVEASDLETAPEEGARFAGLPAAAAKAKSYAAWSKDLVNWVFTNRTLTLLRSPSSKEISAPGEDERAFRIRLQQGVREERDRAKAALEQKYAPKMRVLDDRIRRAGQALAREEEQARQQKMQGFLAVGAGLLGAFLGRRSASTKVLSTATSAARSYTRTRKESLDVEMAGETIEAVRAQRQELEDQFRAEVAELEARMDPSTEALETVQVRPKKTGISVRACGLAWAPVWRTAAGQSEKAWE